MKKINCVHGDVVYIVYTLLFTYTTILNKIYVYFFPSFRKTKVRIGKIYSDIDTNFNGSVL